MRSPAQRLHAERRPCCRITTEAPREPGSEHRCAVAVAVVLVHPEPLVAILALVTVSVFLPLYLPVIFPAFVGAAVIVQADRMLDLKVAPSFGTSRVSVVLAMVAVQAPVGLDGVRPTRRVGASTDGRGSRKLHGVRTLGSGPCR